MTKRSADARYALESMADYAGVWGVDVTDRIRTGAEVSVATIPVTPYDLARTIVLGRSEALVGGSAQAVTHLFLRSQGEDALGFLPADADERRASASDLAAALRTLGLDASDRVQVVADFAMRPAAWLLGDACVELGATLLPASGPSVTQLGAQVITVRTFGVTVLCGDAGSVLEIGRSMHESGPRDSTVRQVVLIADSPTSEETREEVRRLWGCPVEELLSGWFALPFWAVRCVGGHRHHHVRTDLFDISVERMDSLAISTRYPTAVPLLRAEVGVPVLSTGDDCPEMSGPWVVLC